MPAACSAAFRPGQAVVARFAVKPTSSILTPRRTIDTIGADTEIMTKGRHDPCVGIRAVPVGEAMMACVLADHLLRHRGQVGSWNSTAILTEVHVRRTTHRHAGHRSHQRFGLADQRSAVGAPRRSVRQRDLRAAGRLRPSAVAGRSVRQHAPSQHDRPQLHLATWLGRHHGQHGPRVRGIRRLSLQSIGHRVRAGAGGAAAAVGRQCRQLAVLLRHACGGCDRLHRATASYVRRRGSCDKLDHPGSRWIQRWPARLPCAR